MTLVNLFGEIALDATLVAVRDHLVDVKTKLDAINANTDQLEGFTDGIEGLLTSIRDYVDTVETVLGQRLAETTFTGRIGEVQATPTAFTLLARLKDIATALQSVPVTGPLTDGELRAAAVPISAASLPLPAGAALDATLALRYGGGKSPYSATIAAAGNTTVITPATGKRIELLWVSFIPNADNAAANLVRIGHGPASSITVQAYEGYALAHWEPILGAVNARVIVNLATAEPVSLNLTYREVD